MPKTSQDSGRGPRLVVVSNRLPYRPEDSPSKPERAAPVGGLVSAILPVMEREGGVWFGWSGRTVRARPGRSAAVSERGMVQYAKLDLSDEDVSLFYTGFSNRTLWPILHGFPERVHIRRDTYASYRRINRRFAEALAPLLRPHDLVWVHDFHLTHVGLELRRMGWRGKVGHFLHVPFPPPEIFTILPWAHQLLQGLMHYDLVGFQTRRYLDNAVAAVRFELGSRYRNGRVVHEDLSPRFGVYPVGIDPSPFRAESPLSHDELADKLLLGLGADVRMILGVDRLDYTKGIPERLRAFERLLEHSPSVRRKVSLLQISSPSRSRVPEYITEKERVDQLVGQINGRFSEPNWLPVRYLYRTYEGPELAQFYRAADVCLVTPLRDGMNLVAKEFVASQGDDPGVLVLSKFCGATESLRQSLIVNPHDIDGTAEAIHRALRMPKRERRARWQTLMQSVVRDTAQSWCEAFRRDLLAG